MFSDYFTLDWLNFTFMGAPTFPEDTPLIVQFYSLFPELKNWISDNGIDIAYSKGMHYDTRLSICDYFYISYNSTISESGKGNNNGLNVCIPSHGLTTFFGIFGFSDNEVSSCLKFLYDRYCRVSRLDLAYDDFSKLYKPSDYQKFKDDGRLWSSANITQSVQSKKNNGETFYLGKRGSATMLRIYDKNAESGGLIDSIRYEFELHKTNAQKWANYIMENESMPRFTESIFNFIRVLKSNNAKAKRNVDICPDWLSFVEGIAQHAFSEELDSNGQVVKVLPKLRLPSLKNEISVSNSLKWLKSALHSPACFSLRQEFGNDIIFQIMDNLDISYKHQVFSKYLSETDTNLVFKALDLD